ncbi:NAD(P)-binding protein [Aspergillus cavernicola]|uniref:NAD(P)-binding protein n=1 Tax=Aspergillus cavernicola TaxID=176166 RepID=A0ABR4I8Y0_9EURO
MGNTIYLITGASRGIGRGLTEVLLARPNTTVIAAVRSPASRHSQSVQILSKGSGSHLILVKIESKTPIDPEIMVQTLQDKHQIDYLDVVIANAGISEDFSPVHSISIDTVREHIEVNSLGPLYLYQAVYPLLKKSKKPIFVGVGSPLGSIGGMERTPYPSGAYGPSKAMLHWMVRKIHFENEYLISFVVDPGFPQTDMGNAGARTFGLEKAF